MTLKDQVAIVTGAGRNIGAEVCRVLAREGAAVAVVDLDQGRAEAICQELRETGTRAEAFVCDVAQEADIETCIKNVEIAFGRIDILVNNAAISDHKNMFEITLDEWNKVLAVTLTAPFLFTRAAARVMIEKSLAGRIVNVGSTSGYYGRDRATAYAAAKGALANLTRAQAIQLAPYHIRVNSVVPNKIGSPVGKDDFDPTRPVVNLVGRPGVPGDLARAILFLVSEGSSFIDGAALFVDGGVTTMMPGRG